MAGSAFSNLGSDKFEMLRQKGQFYIDKSLFIKDVFESAGQVKLILRPRRFGKSLNLDMLRCFLSEPKTNHALFDGLAICAYPELMAERGEHPAIFLTLKDMGSDSSWPEMLQSVQLTFSTLFNRFAEQLDSVLKPSEREQYQTYIDAKSSTAALKTALQFLTKLLERAQQKKVWVLIDEYDAPLIQASKCDFLPQALDFFRGLFSNALKTNASLGKAILTGVTRISKESIVSGLNNVIVYNALSSEFATLFGFSEDETLKALASAELSERMDEVRSWYNGYLFGGTRIYNPWSIAQFVARRELQAYWFHTGDEAVLKKLLLSPSNDPLQMNQDLDQLLQGKSVTFPYIDNTTFHELERNRDTILTLLLQSGYLTICEILDRGSWLVRVKIPNMEILSNIKTTLFSWIYRIKPEEKNRLIHAFLRADYEEIQNVLLRFSAHLSYYDIPSAGKAHATSALERVYHVFLLGILMALESVYEIDSNLETGNGRADLMLRPRQLEQHPGYIIELKVVEDANHLEKGVEKALEQIREKKYETRLKSVPVSEIHALGICFFRKELRLKGASLSSGLETMKGDVQIVETLPLADPLFSGRAAEIEQIVNFLSEPNSVQARVVFIVGQGGVGKTLLARQVGRQTHLTNGVMELHATGKSAIEIAIELSQKLNYKSKPVVNNDHALAVIRQLFEKYSFLLILDNFNAGKDLPYLIPSLASTRMILTSRDHDIGTLLGYLPDTNVLDMELKIFDDESALQLFKKALGKKYQEEEKPSYLEIAKRLGYLPLALRLAINNMVFSPRWCTSELLDHLLDESNRGNRELLLSQEFVQLERTFGMADEWMPSQKHRQLLQQLACCAEGPIPLDLIEVFEPSQARNLMEELCALSWCQSRRTEEGLFYQLHVLVRQYFMAHATQQMHEQIAKRIDELAHDRQDWMRRERWFFQLKATAKTLLKAKDSRVKSWPIDLRDFCKERGHGEWLMELCLDLEGVFPQDEALLAEARACRAEVLYLFGSYPESLSLIELAAQSFEALDLKYELARSFKTRASIIRLQGEIKQALLLLKREEQLWSELLADAEKADCYFRQAEIYTATGDAEEAKRALEQAIQISKAKSDERMHAAYLELKASMLLTDDSSKALSILQNDVSPIYKRIGDDYQHAVTQLTVAKILKEQGNFFDSVEILKNHSLPIFEQSGDDEKIIETKEQMTDILMLKTDPSEAMKLLREDLIPLYDRLGNLQSKAKALDKVARILVAKGELEEALRIRQVEQLPIFQRLGEVREIAVTMGKIAQIFMQWGRLSEARQMLQEVLKMNQDLGDLDGIAGCSWDLAQMDWMEKQYQSAIQRMSEAYALLLKIGRSEGLAVVGQVFGQILCHSGQSSEGLAILERSRDAFQRLGQPANAEAVTALIAQFRAPS